MECDTNVYLSYFYFVILIKFLIFPKNNAARSVLIAFQSLTFNIHGDLCRSNNDPLNIACDISLMMMADIGL